ncbi:MAG: noncanonical pyrimidine nucleotidase, YjjG family [Dorea sp.]|nr:noncanonical pyrimidine nucleotidase, YjjG family [Dorea sp.]
MGKIKVVLWDIDGTLLDFQSAEKYAIQACFSKFQLGECTDGMLRDYVEINGGYWRRLERGELTKPQVLVGRFEEFFGKHGIDTAKAPAFNEEYQLRLGDTICFCENALETVKALHGRVWQYAVTNGTRTAQERKLAGSGLDKLLEGVFISEMIGIEKPMKGFFDRVFQEIGAYDRDEMMIVGDSLTSDMQGGNNAGIVTCWYNPDAIERPEGLRLDYEIKDIKEVLEITAGL